MTRRSIPQHYETEPWKELFDFTDAALSWTASSGTIENTTDPVTGEPALKWSGFSAGATLSELSFVPTTTFALDDIAANTIKFDVRAEKPGTAMHMIFGMTSLATANKKDYFFSTDQMGIGLTGLLTHQSLNADTFNPSRVWTGSGDTSLTVDKFQIATGGTNVDQVLYFSAVKYGGRSRPQLMFGIDNHSNANGAIQTVMLPSMQALNWPGYMAWSSNQNAYDGETDQADSLAMVNNDGWTVCNHSIDHLGAVELDTYPDPVTKAKQQYTDNALQQISEGFPASHCYKYTAQPRNEMSENLLQALEEMDYLYSRAIAPPFIDSTTAEHNLNWTGTANIHSKTDAGAPVDSTATVDFYLNAAILMGCSINFFTHGVNATDNDFITEPHWDYFMAEIKKVADKNQVDLVSVDTWYKGLTHPRVSATSRVSVANRISVTSRAST